jgi:hypothetical protein
MTNVVQPIDITKIVEALVENFKIWMTTYRLDGFNFWEGIRFVAAAPRQLAEGQVIPEVLKICVEVARESPTYSPVDFRRQSPYVFWQVHENVTEPPTVALNAILATAVILTAISATRKALRMPDGTHVITALVMADLLTGQSWKSCLRAC